MRPSSLFSTTLPNDRCQAQDISSIWGRGSQKVFRLISSNLLCTRSVWGVLVALTFYQEFYFSIANLPLLQHLLIINGLQLAVRWQNGSKSLFWQKINIKTRYKRRKNERFSLSYAEKSTVLSRTDNGFIPNGQQFFPERTMFFPDRTMVCNLRGNGFLPKKQWVDAWGAMDWRLRSNAFEATTHWVVARRALSLRLQSIALYPYKA